MITKSIPAQGGKLKISIPENLNELTMGMLIDLQEITHTDHFHDYDVLSVLSGVPKDKLLTIIRFTDVDVFTDHVLSLTHQLRYTYDGKAIPKHITFGQKAYLRFFKRPIKVKVMGNLSIEPAGAYMAASDVMVDEINACKAEHGDKWKQFIEPSARTCAMVLAHYFYCPVTGKKYEEQNAETFFETVKQLPVQIAMPIARYFFLSWPDLSKQRMPLLLRLRVSWKYARALRRLKNSRSITS